MRESRGKRKDLSGESPSGSREEREGWQNIGPTGRPHRPMPSCHLHHYTLASHDAQEVLRQARCPLDQGTSGRAAPVAPLPGRRAGVVLSRISSEQRFHSEWPPVATDSSKASLWELTSLIHQAIVLLAPRGPVRRTERSEGAGGREQSQEPVATRRNPGAGSGKAKARTRRPERGSEACGRSAGGAGRRKLEGSQAAPQGTRPGPTTNLGESLGGRRRPVSERGKVTRGIHLSPTGRIT